MSGESVVEQQVEDKSFIRSVVKENIPTYNVLGVNIATINMEWLVNYIKYNIKSLSGDYICVSNVYTTVMSYEEPEYCEIQNGGIMAIPDGGPLSALGKKRGNFNMERTTGPNLMEEIFKISEKNGYKHLFYGSTAETLEKMSANLKQQYPNISISEMISPPFTKMDREQDEEMIKRINTADVDFIWVGLGAPKQERWMAEHQGKVKGLMIGVGAGFDFYAGNIKRAPEWMQNHDLEWLYRLIQEPKRLFGRYMRTNTKFLWLILTGK